MGQNANVQALSVAQIHDELKATATEKAKDAEQAAKDAAAVKDEGQGDPDENGADIEVEADVMDESTVEAFLGMLEDYGWIEEDADRPHHYLVHSHNPQYMVREHAFVCACLADRLAAVSRIRCMCLAC